MLATQWDPDGAKAGKIASAYDEWAFGIADLAIHAPPEALVDYLGVLEEQLGLDESPRRHREVWASALRHAVLSDEHC